MKFAKWGNSIAIRVPADVVARLGISPDEDAQIKVTGEHSFEVTRDRRREEAIEALRKLARPLPPGYKFNREELHDRGMMRHQEKDAQ
jgi:antitoxin MazE